MSGSTFGTIFKITTWGESHGKALGVIIDGCPSGLPLCEADIQTFLDRRKPGQNKYTTKRLETDTVEILSGVFCGRTTGTPISMMIKNKDHHSTDYSNLSSVFRPGHADYTYQEKYGFRDFRGGGRSSGRETAGRVAAGAVAIKILKEMGIQFVTYVKSIGPYSISEADYHYNEISENDFYMPNNHTAQLVSSYLDNCMKHSDSSGGIIECRIQNLPSGLGEPVFDKLDASLAKAIFSIGAVKGFEIGKGFASSLLKGSENNDEFYVHKNNTIKKYTNNCGGILGGISDGDELVFRAAIKPTPSIFMEQHTVTETNENMTLQIHGRHDPVIAPRAVVVVESMAALTILDMLLLNMSSRMEKIIDFYK